MDDFRPMNEVYARYFGQGLPARSRCRPRNSRATCGLKLIASPLRNSLSQMKFHLLAFFLLLAPVWAQGPIVRFATTQGNIDVQLLQDVAPRTVRIS